MFLSCLNEISGGRGKIDYFIESAPYGFLFTSCKTLSLKFCNEWIKSVQSTFYGVICLLYKYMYGIYKADFM